VTTAGLLNRPINLTSDEFIYDGIQKFRALFMRHITQYHQTLQEQKPSNGFDLIVSDTINYFALSKTYMNKWEREVRVNRRHSFCWKNKGHLKPGFVYIIQKYQFPTSRGAHFFALPSLLSLF